MKLKLYHYVHCPYCVRVRLALGFLKLPWESIVVPYDDEETPVRLCGKKMLPIMEIDGRPMNESLEIIQLIDSKGQLSGAPTRSTEDFLTQVGDLVHSLAMPYWAFGPEFSPTARAYFLKKKEAKRGPFPQLALARHTFEAPLVSALAQAEEKLTPFWGATRFGIDDIVVAAHLWGLYVVPEFRFSSKWHDYLTRVKDLCGFDYHACLWRRT